LLTSEVIRNIVSDISYNAYFGKSIKTDKLRNATKIYNYLVDAIEYYKDKYTGDILEASKTVENGEGIAHLKIGRIYHALMGAGYINDISVTEFISVMSEDIGFSKEMLDDNGKFSYSNIMENINNMVVESAKLLNDGTVSIDEESARSTNKAALNKIGDDINYELTPEEMSWIKTNLYVGEISKKVYNRQISELPDSIKKLQRIGNTLIKTSTSDFKSYAKGSAIDLLFQKKNNQIKGQADIEARTVLINSLLQSQDTLPHEYAHHYIRWFKDAPIVQEAIKKWGSEEALVQAIGEQVVKQKGEVYGWWKKFSQWVQNKFNKLDKIDKEEIKNLLTDAFLERRNLNNEAGSSDEKINKEKKLEGLRKRKEAYKKYQDILFGAFANIGGKVAKNNNQAKEALWAAIYKGDGQHGIDPLLQEYGWAIGKEMSVPNVAGAREMLNSNKSAKELLKDAHEERLKWHQTEVARTQKYYDKAKKRLSDKNQGKKTEKQLEQEAIDKQLVKYHEEHVESVKRLKEFDLDKMAKTATKESIKKGLDELSEVLSDRNVVMHEVGHVLLKEFMRNNPKHPAVINMHKMYDLALRAAYAQEEAIKKADQNSTEVSPLNAIGDGNWKLDIDEFATEILTNSDLIIELNKPEYRVTKRSRRTIGSMLLEAIETIIGAVGKSFNWDTRTIGYNAAKAASDIMSAKIKYEKEKRIIDGKAGKVILTQAKILQAQTEIKEAMENCK